jgi:hypothetical protein
LAAMSASTKNLRRAWLQQSASVTGRASGRGDRACCSPHRHLPAECP